MKEAHTRNSINHEMDTPNRGEILAANRGARAWPPGNGGRHGRNSFLEPEQFIVGSHGMVGGSDPDNSNDWDAEDLGGRSHA